VDFRLRAAEIVVIGEGPRAQALLDAARKIPPLDRIVLYARAAEDLSPTHAAQEKVRLAAEPQAFACIGETCSLPVTDPAGLVRAIAVVRHS
jgi:uncharacterized protein YyaL (SSP411 family)